MSEYATCCIFYYNAHSHIQQSSDVFMTYVSLSRYVIISFGGNSRYKEKEIDSIRYVIFYEGMSPHVHVKNQ